MAIAWVQQVGNTAGSSTISGTFGSNTTTGNAIIVCITSVFNPTDGNLVKSVTDGGNTYTQLYSAGPYSTSYVYQMWGCFNITGGVTPTVTPSFTKSVFDAKFSAIEVSGIDKVQPVDYITSNNLSVRSANLFGIDTQETKTANNFVILWGQLQSGLTGTYTLGSGFSNLGSWGTSTDGGTAGVESRITSSVSSLSSQMSVNQTASTGVMLGVFSDTQLPPYNKPSQLNNYQFPKAPDGISVSEKIR